MLMVVGKNIFKEADREPFKFEAPWVAQYARPYEDCSTLSRYLILCEELPQVERWASLSGPVQTVHS